MNMEPQPTDELSPFKAEYGKIKHRKRLHVNKWNYCSDSQVLLQLRTRG